MKIFLTAIIILICHSLSFAGSKAVLSPENYSYLKGIAKDTWACIDYLVEPETGLPYDTSNKKATETSVSNIGVYIAAVTVAVDMDFISRNEAINRISKVLDSVENFPEWNGFTQSWHDVVTLSPSTNDPWISVLDSGNLAAGLVVARQGFPELNSRITKLLEAMDWAKIYSSNRKLLIGGYSMKTGQLNKSWLLSEMGSDARASYIIAIGSGKIPPTSWEKISKKKEKKYSLSYYRPGWQGGGLFMQLIDSCFFDLRYTEMWKSAASFAYVQMFHAKLIDSPVWGWSACDSPNDGYLGFNNIRDYVVTPHASVLAISLFPEEAVINLKKLEKMGARAKFEIEQKSYAFGFRDSIDVVKKETTASYLVLDQGMLFLSLCNFLTEGKIWELTNKDPVIQNARQLIPDLKPDKDDFEDFMSMLYINDIYVAVKTVYSKEKYKAKETYSGKISVLCDDVDINGKYKVIWRIINKNTCKKIKSGSTSIDIDEGTSLVAGKFDFKPEEGDYLLHASIRNPDGSEFVSDRFDFSAVDYIDLEGKWLFQTGDGLNMAEADFDDSSWENISVPARWEDRGYQDYDGFAWYRIHLSMPQKLKKKWSNGEIYFSAGGIDDAEQVYFNGNIIGSTAFPPDFKEGYWDKERNYKIPVEYVKFGKENILAVRVYDFRLAGGIWKGPVRIFHKYKVNKSFKIPKW